MTENAGDVELRGGDGDDTFELALFAAGSLELLAGDGADDVRITGDRKSSWSAPIDPMNVDLGPDDDRLAVGNADIGSALFDGGLGTDAYLDLAGNGFALGAPELRSFEVPKASREPPLERRTTLAGRVVDERGRPVPGALVTLPQCELSTATDAAGAFQLGPLEEVRPTLEL